MDNQSQNYPTTQELQFQASNLPLFVSVAFERTGFEVVKEEIIMKIVKDITEEFPKLNEEDFKISLRNGGLGKYGRTFKLTTQEICIWIREYLKEKPIYQSPI